jgi:hypothetical protein
MSIILGNDGDEDGRGWRYRHRCDGIWSGEFLVPTIIVTELEMVMVGTSITLEGLSVLLVLRSLLVLPWLSWSRRCQCLGVSKKRGRCFGGRINNDCYELYIRFPFAYYLLILKYHISP